MLPGIMLGDDLIGLPTPKAPATGPAPTTSAPASATSVLRLAGNSVSQRQIGIVAALIIGTATGVWGAATLMYGSQETAISQLHEGQIERLEESNATLQARENAAEDRADDRCDSRISELRDIFEPIKQGLRQCLGRDISVTISPPD